MWKGKKEFVNNWKKVSRQGQEIAHYFYGK